MVRRVFAWCLSLIVLVLIASPARGQGCQRRTPIHYIGICAHPHGPMHHEWTYDFSGNPVFGVAARQLVACHDVLPLFVYDPSAKLERRASMPIVFRDKLLACEPPPPPKPAPPPAPPKKKDPPPKEKADDDDGGGGKGGGGGKSEGAKGDGSGGGKGDGPSVEERVEKFRIAREDPPRKEVALMNPRSKDMVLPKEGVLGKEGILPKRDEVHPPKCEDPQCTLVDWGGALPELQHGQGRPLVSAVRCQDTKQGCNGKGDGTGKGKALTPMERMIRELTIASAILNGEFNHDLARKDGKRFGIIGGDDEDGVDNAIVQAAAAITQVASAVLVGQAEKFAKKLEEACAKKAPLILQGAEELSKETAELLAKQYGVDIAAALEQNGAIGTYEVMSQFTKNLGGSYQAHHILEKAMAGRLGLTKELDKIPSVILTEATHKEITNKLKTLTPDARDVKDLWKAYQRAYVDYPHWLEAIKPYFMK